MKQAIAGLLISFFGFFHQQILPQMSIYPTSAKVTYVFDGDTIELSGGARVRYIGMNAPEIAHPKSRAQCFGKEAADENKKLVLGKTVTLVSDTTDKDAYGRLLRYVYVGNAFINDELVREGYAVAEPVKPNLKYAQEFYTDQESAKKMKRGLWSACP